MKRACQFSQLQFHKFLFVLNISILFQGRKQKWQQIQGEVAQEYDVVKNIMQTLALFKGTHNAQYSGKPIFFPVPFFTNFCIL